MGFEHAIPTWAEKDPVVIHINMDDFSIGGKHDGLYKNVQWLWGNVITNKATRNPERFAMMLCPRGTKVHYLNHSTFKRYFGRCHKHIYITPVKDEVVDEIVENVHGLSREQMWALIDALKHHRYYEECHRGRM